MFEELKTINMAFRGLSDEEEEDDDKDLGGEGLPLDEEEVGEAGEEAET